MAGKRKKGRVVTKIKPASSAPNENIGTSVWEIVDGVRVERKDHSLLNDVSTWITRSTFKKSRQEVSPSISVDGAVGPIDNNEPWIWLGAQNPLLNDLVLRTILEHVTGNDLMEFRLVCKQWNTQSIPFIRSAFQVSIHAENEEKHSIENFISLMNSEHRSIQFENFVLGSFDLSAGVGLQFLEFAKKAKRFDFWKISDVHNVENISVLLKSAPKLESFVMPSDLSSIHGNTPVKLFEIESEIPKLKFLKTLELERENSENRRTICPTLYQEFLSAAPNVSILSAMSFSDRGSPSLEVLNILDEFGRSIETLNLCDFGEGHLAALKNMCGRKPLKYLNILDTDFRPVDPVWDALMEILKDSLISLRIQNMNTKPLPSKFPRMSKLKHLEFKRYGYGVCQDIIDFEHCFPVLETLTLRSVGIGSYHLKFLEGDESDCFLMMKSFILDKVTICGHIFGRAANAFPNLNVLSLEIEKNGGKILNKIWTQLTKLEKLSLSGKLTAKKNIDALFIGITSERIRRLGESTIRSFGKITIEDRKEAISELIYLNQTLPSIRNLTNLRHLDLCLTSMSENRNRLSDVTGYFGFYSLPHLQHLKISECEFSNTCAEILVKDMELSTWTIRRDNHKISTFDDHIIPPKPNVPTRESTQ